MSCTASAELFSRGCGVGKGDRECWAWGDGGGRSCWARFREQKLALDRFRSASYLHATCTDSQRVGLKQEVIGFYCEFSEALRFELSGRCIEDTITTGDERVTDIERLKGLCSNRRHCVVHTTR